MPGIPVDLLFIVRTYQAGKLIQAQFYFAHPSGKIVTHIHKPETT